MTAKAERLDGILKHEYGMGSAFGTKSLARGALDHAVLLHNERRPHSMLKYGTPSEVNASAE